MCASDARWKCHRSREHLVASMRPRRVRLGCVHQRHLWRRMDQASMRPRRVRLGCGVEHWAGVATGDGFNEAEACAPRMPGLRCLDGRRLPRASMRPRRVRLGCLRKPRAGYADRRCFNEAEACAPRMPGSKRRARRPPAGFNEAEACAPRMPPTDSAAGTELSGLQ